MKPVQSILSTKTGLHKRSFIPEAKEIKCLGLPGGSVVLNPPAKQETQVYPWVGKIPWRSKWQPTIGILAWEVPWTEGYSPWGHKESEGI